MIEIDYLKCKLEDTEKAFDKLHKRHIELLKQQGKLEKENEQLRDELTFLNKVISFFADNPMTKYSSKNELLEEMKLLEKMGLI